MLSLVFRQLFHEVALTLMSLLPISFSVVASLSFVLAPCKRWEQGANAKRLKTRIQGLRPVPHIKRVNLCHYVPTSCCFAPGMHRRGNERNVARKRRRQLCKQVGENISFLVYLVRLCLRATLVMWNRHT